MEKKVGAFEARRQFGSILQSVVAERDRYVIERHGQAVAAVVPIEVYEQWKRQRRAYFDQIRALAEDANVPADEADELVNDAIQAVRNRQSR
ncbi:MAG: type II toxin-antitoxin system Phd/YefM family antitoxin [Anaerolineae bacterium]